MIDLDPYAELDVQRDASPQEIKRAYRRRVKRTHPDVGGTPEQFHRTELAGNVLLNPKLRAAYDETGRFEEPPPDNDRANALQIIEAFMGEAVDAYLMKKGVDPRTVNLIEAFREHTRTQIGQIELQIREGERVLKFVKDMHRRFSGSDPARPIEAMFERRIRHVEAEKDRMCEAVRVRVLAIQIAGTYDFERDEVAPQFSTLRHR